MLDAILQFLGVLLTAAKLNVAITPFSPHVSAESRVEYSLYMAFAGQEYSVDPFLVAAVMWHESDFTNVPRNHTNDYGLMQVHWASYGPPEKWLVGLTKADLMDPWINIRAGTHELAHLRWFCRAKGDHGHDWWGHYKYGVVVPSEDYGKKILQRYQILLNHRPRPQRSRNSS